MYQDTHPRRIARVGPTTISKATLLLPTSPKFRHFHVSKLLLLHSLSHTLHTFATHPENLSTLSFKQFYFLIFVLHR
ncbi:hypothetical protein L6452_16567 [Arctium lappa]|uniref:Uncharacterized protein n=1 Tax=Arctium lappa TaxID=4217 RepID=A0ACB9C176_ARCLA|nr:hypothetical protein L6452_16567 [Arctium lappa]